MRQSWSTLALLLALAALILAAFAVRVMPAPAPSGGTSMQDLSPLEAPTVDFANPSIGELDAPVVIVEFGDFLCDACVRMAPVLDRILTDYAGSVRLVWKDFPNVAAHPGTDMIAIAGRCAQRQGAFWPFHRALMTLPVSPTESSLNTLAAQMGLDAAVFGSCLSARETVPMIDRDFVEGQRLLVDRTPYFFINGRRVSGEVSEDQLIAVLRAAGAVPAGTAAAAIDDASSDLP